MRYLILSLSLLILTSCSHAIAPEVPEVLEVSQDKLIKRDGVTYQVDSDEPFTGHAVRFHENGKLEYKTDYKEGKKNGLSEWYWENGILGQRGNLENDKKNGLVELFDQNGNLIRSVIYKDGIPID
jgi:antitoxin component YwqK of YwqJK toxin-antitoxin module